MLKKVGRRGEDDENIFRYNLVTVTQMIANGEEWENDLVPIQLKFVWGIAVNNGQVCAENKIPPETQEEFSYATE